MGKEWIKLKETGQLFLDKILVSFDIPILFVCENYEKHKYLCLNIDEESGKTVIAETNNKYLIAMLKNEITMEYVFRNAINQKIIVAEYNFKEEKIIANIEDSKIISSDMLPKENEYFELTNKVIKQYISHLENQKIEIQEGIFGEKLLSIPKDKDILNFNAKYSMASIYTCKYMIVTEIKNKYLYNIKNQHNMIA